MFFKLFLAWLGGFITAELIILFLIWLTCIYSDRRDKPPTKDEWKVM